MAWKQCHISTSYPAVLFLRGLFGVALCEQKIARLSRGSILLVYCQICVSSEMIHESVHATNPGTIGIHGCSLVRRDHGQCMLTSLPSFSSRIMLPIASLTEKHMSSLEEHPSAEGS
ncbi:hypothetical protein C8Q73DRAFT_36224 [Cubamyces lactineus]|nr:hypothetical protein C8Q73DRAFT_36224 [Cubamyces lactineus]